MQSCLRRLLFLLLCHTCLASFGQSSLAKLYRRKDYFQLRSELAANNKSLQPADRLFYQAVLHNAFNRPKASDQVIALLRKNFKNTLKDSLRKALLNLEADNAIKNYRYQKAADTYRSIITYCKTDRAERADLENSIALWGAIAEVPQQQIIRHQTAILHWQKDKIGLLQVPVRRGTDTCDLVFDTGANISVITESSAKKLHMRVYPVKLDLGAGTTGQTMQSSLAVADSLWLGPVLMRHVVFLLLPDDMLEFKQAAYRQQGIIGEPLIAQLRQMSFYQDGRLEIPLNPLTNQDSNMALDGAMPIVEYTVNGQHLPFRFDSGASTSVLYEPFYKRFEKLIRASGKPYKLRTGGVGGTINTAEAFKLPEISLKVNSKAFTIREISVRTTPVGMEPDLFYGNMGLDIFCDFQKLTIDFTSMRLDVN
ncbi:retropepsin-like aspartic protease [Mucilaginibacter endophyticus]|uniref:retropepsin-like aspartic protease n=1 Tax=Mucilaginibacter endophyticus TaxID=2675003 RepID=UPI000E0D4C99|nr:retropepsin-like aspartic protease [Mucilaginibacter endophyticus]